MKPNETPQSRVDARIAELEQVIRTAEAELRRISGRETEAVPAPTPSEGEAAQRSLAETQAGILNALEAHIALLDGEGVILTVNEAWRRSASANAPQCPDFFVGQNYIEVCETAQGVCADESQAVARGIRQVLSGAVEKFVLEYPCHSLTEKHWFRLMATPLNAQPGAGAVVMHVNVTERRQAAEERDRLFNLSIDLLSVVSFEGRLQRVNPAWTRCLGWSAEELSNLPLLDFVHPADHAATIAASAALVRGERIHGFENRYRCQDGTYRLLSWNSHPLPETRQIFGVCRDVTEQRQRQEQLRLLETCISRLNDIVLITDAEPVDNPINRILYVNDAFVRRTGYSREEAIGQTPRILQGPKTRRDALDRIRAALKAWRPVREQLINYTKSGEEFWIELEIVPVADTHGLVTHWVAIERDVTERKNAEAALRESEAHLQFALEAAQLGDWEVDLNTRVARHSLRHDRCFGYTEAVAGWSVEKFIAQVHPDDRLRVERDFQTSIAAHAPWNLECRVIWPDATTHWIASQGNVFSVEGAATRLHGIVSDITARKRAEAELAVSEERFRLMVEGSEQVLFYTHDRDHRFDYLSPSTKAVLGYAPEELIGELCDKLVITEDPINATVHEITDKALRDGLPCEPYRVAVRHKDGRRLMLEILESPIVQDGAVVGIQGFAKDITARTKAEEAMKGIAQVQQELALCDLPVQALMELIARRARELTEAAGSVVELVEGAEMIYVAGAGLLADKLGLRLSREGSLSGLAVSTGAVLRADDTETDPRCDRVACRQVGVRSMVVAPLMRVGKEFTGVLKVMSDRPAAFTDRDVNNLRILTETLGAVIQRQRATEQLRQSEGEFRTLAEAMPQIVWITRADGWVTYLNHHWMEYTGRTLGESLGRGWSQPFHPEDRAQAESAWQEATTTAGNYSLECRLRRADGEYRWWLTRGEPLRDEVGRVLKWFGTCTDIHDLKVAQLEIHRTNRALKMLSTCSEVLVRAKTEAALLAAFCQNSREIGGYRLVWVGYAQDDTARTITFEAQSGDENGYLDGLQLSWDGAVATGQGPAGRVIRSGEPVICENIESDALFIPWREQALQNGLRSVICLPLRAGDRTFGVMALYSGEVSRPGGDERKLLQELADDLAFGIGNLRSQHERRRMEAAVMKVATSVSASISDGFFRDLALSVAEALDAQGGFVVRLLPGETEMARTVAAVVDGKVVDNFDYALRGTPCEKLVGTDCVVPLGGAGHFPDAPPLAALKAQAYVGRGLVNAAGQAIGLIFVLFRQPLEDFRFVASTLQIFAARAAAEFERLESDTRIREQAALLDKATDAILVRDLEHRVVFWNRGAEKTYGWSAADVLGRPTPEFLYPDPRIFYPAVEALMEKGEWAGDMEKKNRAGKIVTAACRWTLVRSESGVPETVLCIETDITERKRLEAQFLRAQRMESVGTLAGGIAHDMNNILAPIMMAVELLRGDAKTERAQGILNTLHACSRRGADLVRQLLSFTRGLEGQQIAVELNQLNTELQKVMREIFPKNIEFELSAISDLWPVTGDPTQLHQVFLNLCVNARDAMPQGGKLTISLENVVLDDTYAAMNREGKAGAYVLASVTDTGMGMPPAVLDKIFEPFFTTKELGKGTGLGLSTVIGIIKNHGGFINVYSEEGKGTKFKLYIPAQTSANQQEKVAVAQTGIPRGNGELILLVDDEKSIRDIAMKTLTRFGYRVLEAANGAEAVALYVQNRTEIALVLTDVSMPIMDGHALIAVLRSVDPKVRILVSSGLPINGGVAKAMQAGVRQFIPKPYTAEKLLGIIHEELRAGP